MQTRKAAGKNILASMPAMSVSCSQDTSYTINTSPINFRNESHANPTAKTVLSSIPSQIITPPKSYSSSVCKSNNIQSACCASTVGTTSSFSTVGQVAMIMSPNSVQSANYSSSPSTVIDGVKSDENTANAIMNNVKTVLKQRKTEQVLNFIFYIELENI